MAVRFENEVKFEGAVLRIHEHYWLDGMLEAWAVCWNMETHDTEQITFGYYGIDGSNLAGGTAKVDATAEVKRDVLRTLKRRAWKAFADSVTEYKNEVRAGRTVVVTRGKKVPKGTKLTVFWVGDRPTYMSRVRAYVNETERIAGCYTEDGEKVWVKTEYLQPTDVLKSPNAKERKRFMKDWVLRMANDWYGIGVRKKFA